MNYEGTSDYLDLTNIPSFPIEVNLQIRDYAIKITIKNKDADPVFTHSKLKRSQGKIDSFRGFAQILTPEQIAYEIKKG